MSQNQQSIRLAALKISQYFLFLVFILVWIFTCLILEIQKSSKIPLKEDAKSWDSSINPIWIPHISDTHITDKNPSANQHLRNVFFDMNNLIHPSFMIHTGDIIHQYVRKYPSSAEPNLDHWNLYQSILKEYNIPDDFIYYSIGNHDQWGLLSSTSSKNYVFTNTHVDPKDYYTVIHEYDNIRVISLCPFHFPSAYGGASFICKFTSDVLDALEKSLLQPTEAQYTIVTCHNPSILLHPMDKTSKTKLDLKSLLEKHNVDVFLNGHTHPSTFSYGHYGKVPELTSPPMKTQDGYSFLTIDNGRIGYHFIKTTGKFSKNKKQVVITHPTPHKFQKYIYKDHTFEIRALCFSKDSEECEINAEGYGKLERKREIKNGVNLYSLNIEVDKGIHKLKITGDLEEEIEFAVDCTTGPYYERRPTLFNYFGFTVGFVLFAIFIFGVIVFIWIPKDKLTVFQETEIWIEGKLDQEKRTIKNDSVYWLFCFLLGPSLTGRRINNHSLWVKIVLTFLYVWSFVLPISFLKVENKVGIVWAYGYIIDGTFIFDMFSFFFTAIYYIIFYIWMNWLSLVSFGLSLRLFIIDIILTIILLFISYCIWVILGSDYITKGFGATSFEFVFFPIIMICLTVFLFYQKPKVKCESVSENESESLSEESDKQNVTPET